MLPAESGITYALGLLGGRRTVDGGPEKAFCQRQHHFPTESALRLLSMGTGLRQQM